MDEEFPLLPNEHRRMKYKIIVESAAIIEETITILPSLIYTMLG